MPKNKNEERKNASPAARGSWNKIFMVTFSSTVLSMWCYIALAEASIATVDIILSSLDQDFMYTVHRIREWMLWSTAAAHSNFEFLMAINFWQIFVSLSAITHETAAKKDWQNTRSTRWTAAKHKSNRPCNLEVIATWTRLVFCSRLLQCC